MKNLKKNLIDEGRIAEVIMDRGTAPNQITVAAVHAVTIVASRAISLVNAELRNSPAGLMLTLLDKRPTATDRLSQTGRGGAELPTDRPNY